MGAPSVVEAMQSYLYEIDDAAAGQQWPAAASGSKANGPTTARATGG
jgi:hypothetical protein